jgi:uncharacterized membrane protein YfcA
MLILSFLAYLIIGGISGFAGGLLGIGGGSISVPALLLVFSLLGFPHAYIMHYAVGTSLAAMSINAISASYFHNKNHTVHWNIVKKLFIGVVVGSFIGVLVAKSLSTDLLKMIFGFFACLIGLHLARPLVTEQAEGRIPGFFPFNAISAAIACLANILGIGGGIFIVPLLCYYHLDTKKAIGTSIVCTFFIITFGTLGYLLAHNTPDLVPYSLGYVYFPAFIVIGVSSFFSAYYGAKLVQKIPVKTIRRIFSLSLIGIGLTMLLK